MPAPNVDVVAALRRLGCSPAEVLAVAILATAAVAVVALLWVGSSGAEVANPQ
ncbi:MAG: hypothetical protein ICV72_10480, partial [Aldersonia sp.]|nr:hypothetical protein [Aldersonia sp.]